MTGTEDTEGTDKGDAAKKMGAVINDLRKGLGSDPPLPAVYTLNETSPSTPPRPVARTALTKEMVSFFIFLSYFSVTNSCIWVC